MRMTMQELRAHVRSMLSERGIELRKQDVFTNVQYDPKRQAFLDRWGHDIPGPETSDLEDVGLWLNNNDVESIDVKGKRFSPKSFMRRLSLAGVPVVNPGGGLIGDGHPVGATGVRQLVEATMHLRNDAGQRQIPNCKRYMTFNMGGSFTTAVAAIWGV